MIFFLFFFTFILFGQLYSNKTPDDAIDADDYKSFFCCAFIIKEREREKGEGNRFPSLCKEIGTCNNQTSIASYIELGSASFKFL